MSTGQPTRRSVIQAAAAASAAPMFVPASAFGANDKISMGAIGWGMQGPGNTGQFMRLGDVHVKAVCDIDAKIREGAVKNINSKQKSDDCTGYEDYNELLARDDIDAVMIAVPDHWHGVLACAAAKAGKHIYGEKPLAHTFPEQQAIVKAVHDNKVVWQTGSWQRSQFNFRWGVELVRNRILGEVTRIEVGLPSGHHDFGRSGKWRIDEAAPEHINWDKWCGPSSWMPYNASRHHRNWRWNYQYGGGQMMDWIGHHNDIAHWGMDWDHTGPTEVKATAEFPPAYAAWNTAGKYRVECKYPGNVETVIAGGHGDIGGGTKWIGKDGWVHVNRGKFTCSNKEWTKKDFDRGEIKIPDRGNHFRDFIDAIKEGRLATAHVDAAHRAATPGHLAHVALKMNATLKWDAEKEQIVGNDDAQKMLMAFQPRGDWKL